MCREESSAQPGGTTAGAVYCRPQLLPYQLPCTFMLGMPAREPVLMPSAAVPLACDCAAVHILMASTQLPPCLMHRQLTTGLTDWCGVCRGRQLLRSVLRVPDGPRQPQAGQCGLVGGPRLSAPAHQPARRGRRQRGDVHGAVFCQVCRGERRASNAGEAAAAGSRRSLARVTTGCR
jgi:hypothetical protein